MTPALLLPAALAALAALIVPLVIHLAGRTEQRPTDFAALRWLRERPRPRHRPRLDEWPLLIARLLLIALIALWLARPAVFGAHDPRPVVAVVPGVARPVVPESDRAIWLAPGFPALATPPPATTTIASLLRQLDADLAPGVPLRVIVPAIVQGLDGERPRLSRAVTWQLAGGAMPAPPRAPDRTPTVAVRQAGGSPYVAAAVRAWGGTDIGTPARPIVPGTRILAWLVPGPIPAQVQAVLDRGGTMLVAGDTIVPASRASIVWRDASGGALIEERSVPRGRLLRLTQPLVPATSPMLLDPDFPQRLRALLLPQPPPPARAMARDVAPVTGGDTYPQPARDVRPWLAIAIAALLLIERWLATRRKRSMAP
ncbi:MAG TPA: BatA domain-containing protein [Sphingomonas sp.]|jgi:hypothetical protein|nr:BatA domain-containing protein [Sphingomonas sp.]